ncbi:MAG: hypothetical protein Q9170_006964 [Blastenia crenularia]
MPKAPKVNKKLSYLKCQRCRFDKAKVDIELSAFQKIGYGLGLVAIDANASVIHAQKAVPKLKKLQAHQITSYGDLTWLKQAGLEDEESDEEDIHEDYEPLRWYISNTLKHLVDEILERASIYSRQRQMQESLYLGEQLYTIQTMTVVGYRNHTLDLWALFQTSSMELAEFHESIGNHVRAEMVLVHCLLVAVYERRLEPVINQLVQVYRLLKERLLVSEEHKAWVLSAYYRVYHDGLLRLGGLVVYGFLAAAKHDACNLARYLLDQGANIGALDNLGRTALHMAAEYGSIEMVKLLIRRGASIEARDAAMRTPLFTAVESKSIEVVTFFLSEGAEIEAQDKDHQAVLIHAASRSSPDIVLVLIREGATINAADRVGSTALHRAAEFGKPQILETLLRRNANIESQDSSGDTVLHVPCKEYYLYERENLDVLQVWIDRRLPVDSRNKRMETALHLASQRCIQTFTLFLLRSGASLIAEACHGTPLHYAIESGLSRERRTGLVVPYVHILLEHGAPVNFFRQFDNKTPLHLAAQLTNKANSKDGLLLLQLLLDYGGDVQVLCNSLNSALDYAKDFVPAADLLRKYRQSFIA